jgi:predicted ferric reductase
VLLLHSNKATLALAVLSRIVLISSRMSVPESVLKVTAKLHRRWGWLGMGALLFTAFCSFFFAGHLELVKTTVYMKDGVVPGADAGSKGTGAASSFLLVHRIPVAVMEAGWRPFSKDAVEVKKRAVGTLQGIAGALAVVFLYHLLLWSRLST